jgi:putative restriction endonuclease
MPLPYTKLNPNKSKAKGYAPHKPLLLLCIIDLAEAGELDPPLLFKTPGLRLRFDSDWHHLRKLTLARRIR